MEPVRAGDTAGIRTRMHRCTNLRLCHLSYGAMLPGCPGCHALLTSALPLFSPYRGARLSGLSLVSIRPVQAPVLLVSHAKVYFTKKQSAHLSLELGPADGNYTYRCGSCLGLKHNYFIPALCQLWVLDAAFTPRGSEANNSCAGS